MRVAIVIDSLARGGAERQAIHAARELGRSGCDVELIHYHRVARTYDELSFGAATWTYLPKDGRYSAISDSVASTWCTPSSALPRSTPAPPRDAREYRSCWAAFAASTTHPA